MLEITGLTVRYGDHTAVADLDLEAAAGEVVCVLGPSGCGKSTLLRAIAGLERPEAGRIHLDGRDLAGLRPDERQIGLMFQDQALFPHRTVAQNVAFGPRMQGLAPAEIGARVDQALAMVDLADTGQRRIDELSGGEQQRVALARAVAPRPRLLMLDEPLGSLDRTLRDRLLDELPRLFDQLGTTVLYVTHDHQEALSLADRVAVMRAGRLEQQGAPDDLWRRPRTPFVARFLGMEPILRAEVVDGVAHTRLGALPLPGAPDGACDVVVLPGALRLLDATDVADGQELVVDGRVLRRRFAGTHTTIVVGTTAGPELTVDLGPDLAPTPGTEVRLGLDPGGVHRPGEGGQ